jgi:oxygen-dependent protoporphyrinogen oxidase
VAVVNLAYRRTECDTGLDGFGFLTPHRDAPHRNKVPGLLGVIFDSNSLGKQDENNGLVRFTAMIGGSDWDLAFDGTNDSDVAPQALALAQTAMQSCLGIHASPVHSRAHILRQCLPQYTVNHRQRMRDLHVALQEQTAGRLSVAGSSYLGVSVPDCVKHSRLLVDDLISVGALGNMSVAVTGLEKATQDLW